MREDCDGPGWGTAYGLDAGGAEGGDSERAGFRAGESGPARGVGDDEPRDVLRLPVDRCRKEPGLAGEGTSMSGPLGGVSFGAGVG